MGNIQDAVFQKNFERIKTSAHKLKGTLKYLAAEPAASAAMAIELAGCNHDMDNLNEKFLTLEKECQNIAAFIKGFAP